MELKRESGRVVEGLAFDQLGMAKLLASYGVMMHGKHGWTRVEYWLD